MLALNIQPRPGAADLALVEEDGTGRPGSGAFQVGVGHDDGRGLAAQFQGHAGHGVHGDLADLLTHGGGASEGQFVHQRVVGQRRACGDSGAGHHVKHAFGVTGFLHQFGQFKRAQRGFIGRLQHHGAAGCQRRAEFPAGQQQREVPGHDSADHAHRFTANKAVELIVGHQRQRHLDAGTLDLCRPTGHITQKIDGQLHVHDLGHGSTFTVVQAFQLRQ